MGKPTNLPEFDKNETDVDPTDTARKDDGFLVSGGVPEKPSYKLFNYLLNSYYKWLAYFDKREKAVTHNITVDADYTLTDDQNDNGRIIITDTGVLLTTGRNIIVSDIERMFIIQNNTLQSLVIKTSAGTGISVPSNTSSELICDGTNVISSPTLAVASTAEAQAWTDNTKAITPLRLAEALQGANQSIAVNGYQKLPGGLILQWGTAGSVALNSNVAVSFPVTFPTAVLSLSASLEYTASGDDMFDGYTSLTTSGFNLENGGGVTSVDSKWFAIGY